MAQAKGARAQLLGGMKEVTFGVAPVTPQGIILPFIPPLNLKADQAQKQSNVIRGSRNPQQPFVGNVSVGGSINIPVEEIALGYWFNMMFGAATTTGAGDPYTHIFKVPAVLPSWTLEVGYTDLGQYIKYLGCKVDSMSIKAGGDDELQMSVEIMGASEAAPAGASIDSTPTTLGFNRLGNFQGTVEEGGASIATIQSVDLTIKNNLDGDTYCIAGGGTRSDIGEGLVEVSGKIKAMFDSMTLYNKAVNRTESSLKLKFTNSTHYLEFMMNEVNYGRTAPGVPGPGGIWVELPFNAFLDNHADASAIVVTLVNGHAAYIS